jgi:hypothetical protein
VRLRELMDSKTGKTWSSRCDGSVVLVRAGSSGKEKESLKPQESNDAAIAWAEKEEWKRLKQGFILSNVEAKPGEPRMHRYRGAGYTGALPVQDVDGQLLCCQYEEVQQGDHIFLLDDTGALTSLPGLPPNCLIWKACYAPGLQKLLLKTNDQVLSWTIGAPEFSVLSLQNLHPVSCLDVLGKRAVWYAEPDLVVMDIETGQTLFRQPLAYEKFGGHSPQMEAALSPDGATVACCVRAGEIVLWDIASGKARATLNGGFEMVVGLTFTPDGRHLLVREQYGQWAHLCFDLSTMMPRNDWFEPKDRGANVFALSPDGSRIAITEGNHIEVFDFATLKSHLRFRVDHIIKRCNIAWVGRWLGVQTDYGCASLYTLD